jgi:hypothetical protein
MLAQHVVHRDAGEHGVVLVDRADGDGAAVIERIDDRGIVFGGGVNDGVERGELRDAAAEQALAGSNPISAILSSRPSIACSGIGLLRPSTMPYTVACGLRTLTRLPISTPTMRVRSLSSSMMICEPAVETTRPILALPAAGAADTMPPAGVETAMAAGVISFISLALAYSD